MQDRVMLGLIEPVKINGREIMARVDTGAERSSIHDELAKELGIELNEETQKIRSAHGLTRRALGNVDIEIGGQFIKSEFTIYDRSKMKYLVLIGHDVLKQGNFLIDPLKEGDY